MSVETVTTTQVSCDNPNCPGHPELDPAKTEGWLLINHEVYGEPSQSNVFGSYECLSAASTMAASNDGPMVRKVAA